MTEWDYYTDLLVVGSGGGLAGAVTAAKRGLDTLVVEKEDLIGGSTAMSGGVVWLPHNPLMVELGISDSVDQGLEYFESVVGPPTPASSLARRRAYIEEGSRMVEMLRGLGVRFVPCAGYSDYYAGVRGYHGGVAESRAIACEYFDAHRLGPWEHKLRASFTGGVVVYTHESSRAQLVLRTPEGRRVAARVLQRTLAGRLKRQARLCNGGALVGSLLEVLLSYGVPVWTAAKLVEIVAADGRVLGAVVEHEGRRVRVRARGGVLLNAGGFSHNRTMRERYSGQQPNSSRWTTSNPGDTGEVMQLAMGLGAAVDLMDEAWWIPTAIRSDGSPVFVNGERCKPGSIMVDSGGNRYFNEALPYMEAVQRMYQRDRTVPSLPSWFIMDSRYRRRYPLSFRRPGISPKKLKTRDFTVKAPTLEALAVACGIDARGLEATVERFNEYARRGVDDDFRRGEGAHERWYGDDANRPNPCLGPIDRPPFYAVALYPGDVGTSGGLICDDRSRVLDEAGDPIPGLYASGNTTASVMGRTYPGPGASIGASLIFAYIAAQDVADRCAAAAAP